MENAQAPTNDQDPKEQTEALFRLTVFANFFNSVNGRLIMEYLRESLDGSTYRSDPYESAYAAGRRSVYLNILQAVGQGIAVMEAPEPKRVHQAKAELPATIEEL